LEPVPNSRGGKKRKRNGNLKPPKKKAMMLIADIATNTIKIHLDLLIYASIAWLY
jgi:hypothetical protein